MYNQDKITQKLNDLYWKVHNGPPKGKDAYYVKNFSALSFVTSIMGQLKKRGRLSEKQMAGLNKVYKKYMKMKENKDVWNNV